MAEKEENSGFVCKGDCLECTREQRLYCSSQHSRQSFIMLNSVIERMESLEQTLNGMKLKLDASDKGVFNPLAVSVAQSEGGADKDPLNKLNE